MKTIVELIANKPWILIIAAFLLLISVWVVFFVLAARNQPERLPLSAAPGTEMVRLPANETAPEMPLGS